MAELCLVGKGRELFDAFTADELAAEKAHFVIVAAETAVGGVFFKNDLIVLYEYLQTVFGADAEGLAQFFGQYDSAELVNGANNAGGFHCSSLLRFTY
jgi:hypothetical protein